MALCEQRRGRKDDKKYIGSEEIEAAIRKKKISCLTALSMKKHGVWENYKKDRRNVKRLIAHESDGVWDQKCDETETEEVEHVLKYGNSYGM